MSAATETPVHEGDNGQDEVTPRQEAARRAADTRRLRGHMVPQNIVKDVLFAKPRSSATVDEEGESKNEDNEQESE